jgi:hypothetical protein
MKPYKQSRDGRGAYLALRSRYLGPNNVNLRAAELESQFQGLSYAQETRRWSFKKYVNKHVELHNIQKTSNGMDIPEWMKVLVFEN